MWWVDYWGFNFWEWKNWEGDLNWEWEKSLLLTCLTPEGGGIAMAEILIFYIVIHMLLFIDWLRVCYMIKNICTNYLQAVIVPPSCK